MRAVAGMEGCTPTGSPCRSGYSQPPAVCQVQGRCPWFKHPRGQRIRALMQLQAGGQPIFPVGSWRSWSSLLPRKPASPKKAGVFRGCGAGPLGASRAVVGCCVSTQPPSRDERGAWQWRPPCLRLRTPALVWAGPEALLPPGSPE